MSDQKTPDGMIPANEFAKSRGIDLSEVIDRIEAGFYAGRRVGGEWFIASTESTNSADSSPDGILTAVTGFLSLSLRMLKWTTAAIPSIWLFMSILNIMWESWR